MPTVHVYLAAACRLQDKWLIMLCVSISRSLQTHKHTHNVSVVRGDTKQKKRNIGNNTLSCWCCSVLLMLLFAVSFDCQLLCFVVYSPSMSTLTSKSPGDHTAPRYTSSSATHIIINVADICATQTHTRKHTPIMCSFFMAVIMMYGATQRTDDDDSEWKIWNNKS